MTATTSLPEASAAVFAAIAPLCVGRYRRAGAHPVPPGRVTWITHLSEAGVGQGLVPCRPVAG